MAGAASGASVAAHTENGHGSANGGHLCSVALQIGSAPRQSIQSSLSGCFVARPSAVANREFWARNARAPKQSCAPFQLPSPLLLLATETAAAAPRVRAPSEKCKREQNFKTNDCFGSRASEGAANVAFIAVVGATVAAGKRDRRLTGATPTPRPPPPPPPSPAAPAPPTAPTTQLGGLKIESGFLLDEFSGQARPVPPVASGSSLLDGRPRGAGALTLYCRALSLRAALIWRSIQLVGCRLVIDELTASDWRLVAVAGGATAKVRPANPSDLKPAGWAAAAASLLAGRLAGWLAGPVFCAGSLRLIGCNS